MCGMNDHETTLEQITDVMRQFVRERNWQPFHTPKNLAMSLAIESAEVMELFQWLTAEESLALAEDPEKRGELADELSDVLAYLVSIAAVMKIDLAAAFESKMKRVRVKYPAPETGTK
jgi:dCTP diphosphatase